MRRILQSVWLVMLAITLSSCAFPGIFDTDQGIPREAAEAILNTQQEAASMLAQLLESEDPDSVQAIVEWMQSQPLVVDAQATASGNIEILYECGLSAWIMTSSMGMSPASITLTTTDQTLREPLGEHMAVIPEASGQGKEALILLPHNTELGTPTSLPFFADQLELCGYTVSDPVIGEKASLELFGDIGTYDLVYVVTHGNAHEISLIHQTALATGTKADPNWFVRTGKRIWEIGIEVMTMKNGEHYLAVNGRFFDDLTYSGTAVIANACESLKYDVLANAFLDHGAKCFIGWTEVSNTHLVNVATAALAQALSVGSSTLSAIWTTSTEFDIGSWGSMHGVSGSHTLDELFPWCYGSGLGEHCPDFVWAGDPSFALGGTLIEAEAPILFLTNYCESTVVRVNCDGTGAEILGDLSDEVYRRQPCSIAIDPVREKLYVASAGRGYAIQANLDGTGVKRLHYPNGIMGGCGGIGLDVQEQNLYVLSGNEVIRVNVDDISTENLGDLNGMLDHTTAIALDGVHGRLYVVGETYSDDDEVRYSIIRANLDGTNAENLGDLNGLLSNATIALDPTRGNMYVATGRWPARIVRSKLDGTEAKSLGDLNGLARWPLDIALDLEHQKIYVTDLSGDYVCRCNLDGSQSEILFTMEEAFGDPEYASYTPMGITLWFPR